MKPIRITLYKMENCTHCVKFEPEWNKMKQISNSDIDFVERERSDLESLEPKDRMINGEEIEGFPTIKIELNKFNKKVEYEYSDAREAKNIYMSVLDRLNKMKNGKVEEENTSDESVESVESNTEIQMGGGLDKLDKTDKLDELLALNLSDMCGL